MKASWLLIGVLLYVLISVGAAVVAECQEPEQQPDVIYAAPRESQNSAGQARSPRGESDVHGRAVFGKISAIQGDSIEIAGPDGSKTKLKLTASTEFRKDRQPAKVEDFKVGDPVVVRTDQPGGKGTIAVMVAGGQGFGMRGGAGPGGGFGPGGGAGMFGALGKDFVVGEVKSIDAPRLTVMRTDNVSQTLELNEETSLRRGRDSITMADIQVGDHVFARGALENNVFVPKNVNVIPPEMWKRMQEMNAGAGPGAGASPAAPNQPAPPPSPKDPPEPEN